MQKSLNINGIIKKSRVKIEFNGGHLFRHDEYEITSFHEVFFRPNGSPVTPYVSWLPGIRHAELDSASMAAFRVATQTAHMDPMVKPYGDSVCDHAKRARHSIYGCGVVP